MADVSRREILFLCSIVAGAVLGVLAGSFYPQQAVSFGFLGHLFLNALKMMVLPLIVTSLIAGVTNLGSARKLGRFGFWTLFYYLTTTGFAVLVGILLVDLIRPGIGYPVQAAEVMPTVASDYSVQKVLLGIIHPNLIQAAANFDILPLIFASLLFGAAVNAIGEKGRAIASLIDALQDTVMRVVHWIVLFTPFGVFGLIAERLGKAGGGEAVLDLFMQLGKYCGTVILGLAIHGLVILPVILFLFSGRNPLEYGARLGKAILTAFSTSSSSATLPVTMEGVQEAGVSKKSADFVLPIGATVNMDGTALYEAVAAIFIAQSYGIDLEIGHKVIIFLMATLAAIGAAGIPEAGLVTMVLVLQAVGLPVEGIGLILAIDWFLDRCRTTVNVWGDAVGAAVIDRWEARSRI